MAEKFSKIPPWKFWSFPLPALIQTKQVFKFESIFHSFPNILGMVCRNKYTILSSNNISVKIEFSFSYDLSCNWSSNPTIECYEISISIPYSPIFVWFIAKPFHRNHYSMFWSMILNSLLTYVSLSAQHCYRKMIENDNEIQYLVIDWLSNPWRPLCQVLSTIPWLSLNRFYLLFDSLE